MPKNLFQDKKNMNCGEKLYLKKNQKRELKEEPMKNQAYKAKKKIKKESQQLKIILNPSFYSLIKNNSQFKQNVIPRLMINIFNQIRGKIEQLLQ